MAKIQTVLGSDVDPNVTPGLLINVNSANEDPTRITATPSPGTPLLIQRLSNCDWFTAQQTSAGTDQITLPNTAPIGTELQIYAISAVAVRGGLTGSGVGINGGANTTSVAIAAGSIGVFKKLTATNWTCITQTAAGVIATPTPA